MEFWIKAYVLAFIVNVTFCQRCYFFTFQNFSYGVPASEYLNLTLSVVKEMYFNAEAMLYKSINDPYIKFDVSSSAKKKSDEFHLRKTMRFCDFGRLAKYNTIFQMISDALGNTTNIPFRCPLNAGHYYIRNFRLEASVFPYQLFYSQKASIYFQAKVYSKERSKLLEVVYTNSKFAIEKRC
ncbi:uncharacterized protein LOC119656878 [Hermetia illucens]|uniref:uncharacterized protein LOC119656878 n=1 Tax=Hermetia illucens TaxID=343691 RepID=UPI0018CC218C|nr:uncharacterized protein LOC119656878 [Hermetia illucens]